MFAVRSVLPKAICVSIAAHSSRIQSCVAFARRVQTSQRQESSTISEDVWKSWQFGGLNFDAISEKSKLSKDNVFQQLVVAIESGKPVDWIELSKEVNLSFAAANEIYECRSKTKSAAALKKLAPKVTNEQIQLCNIMLERGFSIHDIRAVISGQPGYFTNDEERLRSVSGELQKSRKISKDFFRVTRDKKILLDQGLMDLLQQRDGASLLEIAAIFSDCDQKQLVDLLYELEKAGNIRWADGKYRAVHVQMY